MITIGSQSCFEGCPPSSRYHKDPLSGKVLCSPCFDKTNKIDLLIQQALRTCADCDATEAPQWYKCKGGQYQCGKCNYIARRDLALSGNSGKTCAVCESTKTPHWYKYKKGESKDQAQCKHCYNAAMHKAKKALDTAKACSSSKKRSITLIDCVKNPSEQGYLSRTVSKDFSSNLWRDLLNDSFGAGGGA